MSLTAVSVRYGGEISPVFTHCLIGTDGVDLRPKHDCSEDQKKKTLEAEEDEEDDSCWWREATAFWRGREREQREKDCSCQKEEILIATK